MRLNMDSKEVIEMEAMVMPECLYRASNRSYGDRFPLKARGNDIGQRSSSKQI